MFSLSQTDPRLASTWVVIRERPMVTLTVADPTATTHPSDTTSFLLSRTGPVGERLRVAYSLGGTGVGGGGLCAAADAAEHPGRAAVGAHHDPGGRGTQFDTRFKTVRLTIEPLGEYNRDLSNRER